jgi:nitrate/nitrite transporter NarK
MKLSAAHYCCPTLLLALLYPSCPLSLPTHSFSASGFHSYLQDVSKGNAGVVFGITNSVSIAAGIFGNLLTGMVLEATGAYSSVFLLFAGLNVSAALLFATCTSEVPVVL